MNLLTNVVAFYLALLGILYSHGYTERAIREHKARRNK